MDVGKPTSFPSRRGGDRREEKEIGAPGPSPGDYVETARVGSAVGEWRRTEEEAAAGPMVSAPLGAGRVTHDPSTNHL